MIKHWSYLKYVIRHKWFVFLAGLDRGVPLWQLLIHNWSKFLPWEWMPYAEWFNGLDGGSWHPMLKTDGLLKVGHRAPGGLAHPDSEVGRRMRANAESRKRGFERAFLFHLHLNPHHHQYWRLHSYGTTPEKVYPIPHNYLLEMLADWDGAGRAITGKADTLGWYKKNRTSMVLDGWTRLEVERLLGFKEEK